jgi:hypothetical protein
MNPLIPAIISGIISSSTPQTPEPELSQTARPLPGTAIAAVMDPPVQGYARFGAKTLHLAPGLQIRDAQNRIVMSGTVQQPVAVRYQLDMNGDVRRIWILTPAEAARSDTESQ